MMDVVVVVVEFKCKEFQWRAEQTSVLLSVSHARRRPVVQRHSVQKISNTEITTGRFKMMRSGADVQQRSHELFVLHTPTETEIY